MAMRAAAMKAASSAADAPRGLRVLLFSTSTFRFTSPPPLPPLKQPPPDPATNLFISGLGIRTTTDVLRAAFAKFGNVVDAKVVIDRVSGISKGFGFVRYATLEEAEAGLRSMHRRSLEDTIISAEYARPRNPPPPTRS